MDAIELDGEKTQDVSNLFWVLRSGRRGTIYESKLGGLGPTFSGKVSRQKPAIRRLLLPRQKERPSPKIDSKASAALDRLSQAENARWEKQKEKLEAALRRATG